MSEVKPFPCLGTWTPKHHWERLKDNRTETNVDRSMKKRQNPQGNGKLWSRKLRALNSNKNRPRGKWKTFPRSLSRIRSCTGAKAIKLWEKSGMTSNVPDELELLPVDFNGFILTKGEGYGYKIWIPLIKKRELTKHMLVEPALTCVLRAISHT